MQTIAYKPSAAYLAGLASTLPARLLTGLAATAVVAASAHVAIPLPFTPVPLTLQTLAVLGVGLALGPVAGFLAMLAYLAEGAAGLPVFSPTGPGGVAQLLGPTGGFLMAYPVVAAVAGGVAQLLRGRARPFWPAAIAGVVAVEVLFLCGAGWLMHLAKLTPHAAWNAAVAPFLPGEAVKIVIAAGVYSTLTNSTLTKRSRI
jgi:biotin transport system substrate-specific component